MSIVGFNLYQSYKNQKDKQPIARKSGKKVHIFLFETARISWDGVWFQEFILDPLLELRFGAWKSRASADVIADVKQGENKHYRQPGKHFL
jgi:hypothetical protein